MLEGSCSGLLFEIADPEIETGETNSLAEIALPIPSAKIL